MKPILHTSDLGKDYRIGGPSGAYQTLRESLMGLPQRTLDAVRRRHSKTTTLQALRDVSFDVHPGEVVGIIGRNGAGKSTLLKLLSRVTEPTHGGFDLYGRVGSLLEVGAGFHPELTGRENIFLNGAVLGMTRAEIKRQFDAIVAFAEVDRMLDTPIKRFSSGMFVRLAFAVAAHLETEVLLVDEVLAVGDAAFQKKCLGKMSDVTSQGRTVLLVSHQMSAIKSICRRVLWIDGGTLREDGPPDVIIDQYLRATAASETTERTWDAPADDADNPVRLRRLAIVDDEGQPVRAGFTSRPLHVEMDVDLSSIPHGLCIGFDLIHRDGTTVLRSNHNDRAESDWPALQPGRNRIRCTIPGGLLSFGTYHVQPRIGVHGVAWLVNHSEGVSIDLRLDHSDSPFWTSENPLKFPGVIAPCLSWEPVEERVLSMQGEHGALAP